MRRGYVLLLLTVSVLEFLPLFLAPTQPALRGDNLGHLFKVHELMDVGWKPWIEEWYAGFPFLRFYPPASYLTAAFFGKLLGSALRGYAVTLMLSAFLGALALHFYLKRLKREPYTAPLVFLLFPWHLGVAYIEGNFPRANAINLSPLFLLGVLLLSEHRERYLILSALSISLVLLTHHSIVIPLLILALALHWESLGELRVIGNSLRVAGAVIFLTAFWYIPFFYDRKWADFWRMDMSPWLFKHYSLSPSYLTRPEMAIPLVLTILLWGMARKLGRGDIRKMALLAAAVYLSLGYYSPTPWLYSLPIVSLIPPYRWLDVTNVLVPLIVADALSGLEVRKATAAGLITLVVLLVPFTGEIPAIGSIPQDTLQLAGYLAEQPGSGWRFLVNNPGAVYSYLPALSGKDTLNGWYHEGNPADREMNRLWYLIATNGNASPYLKAYDVRYLINAEEPGYVEVARIGRYRVYEANVSFVQPVSALMVGHFYDLPLDYAYTKRLPLNISGVNVIIYSGNPDNETAKRLLKFLKGGGTLVWVPNKAGVLFGVNASVRMINSSELSSAVYNVSRFAQFRYGNSPWYGPVFTNVTPLVRMGNWTLIGVKRVGRGTLYALGGNFLYHIAYTGSRYELRILRDLIPPEKIKIERLTRGEGSYSFEVTTEGSALLRVSEAYFPYWNVRVNGHEVKVTRDDRTGLTLINVGKGASEVSAVFKDPLERLRYYSALAWAILALYALMKFAPMRRLSGPEL
ncbi:6-pyruvoyl-tetrahydropterin synthase-related protein [Thermococcus prieurii]